MKTITKFAANDGTEFDSPAECAQYEAWCEEIAAISATWPGEPVKGEGFIQQDRNTVLWVQKQMVDFFERHHWKDQHTQWARNATVPAGMTLIGRYVDDAGLKPERKVWARLARLDKQFREYEQPYYAIQADRFGE